MKKPLIGTHISYTMSEQLLCAVKETISSGATSGAFYVSNSRGYNKYILNIEKTKEAQELALKNNIDIKNYIVHAPLVGNIANTDNESNIFDKTVESYLSDLKTMQSSGLVFFNFHPGSNANREKGIKRIAEGINILLNKTKGDSTILLLETMMAKGNYIGKTFEDLRDIINLVEDKTRIGVCVDTCHIWDGGYDVRDDLDNVLKEFDEIVGINYLKALHVNDSMNELGSNKDRHARIGDGYIGEEALKRIVRHPLLFDLPKANESPKSTGIKFMIEEIKALL